MPPRRLVAVLVAAPAGEGVEQGAGVAVYAIGARYPVLVGFHKQSYWLNLFYTITSLVSLLFENRALSPRLSSLLARVRLSALISINNKTASSRWRVCQLGAAQEALPSEQRA